MFIAFSTTEICIRIVQLGSFWGRNNLHLDEWTVDKICMCSRFRV